MAAPPTFLILIVVIAMISGSISCVASLTIIVMICRSNLKLSTIYRRLIFGISVFDVIQSFSQITGALFMPKGSMWSAVGNDISCNISGLLTTIGICGAVFYSVSISIYFLCVVKYDMEERTIKKYIEPFLHAVPIIYALSVGTYIASVNYFNPAGPLCWINGDDKFHREVLQWLGGYGPFFSGFIFNCIILAMLWWAAYSHSRQMSEICMRGSITMVLPSTQQESETNQQQRQGIRGSISSISTSVRSLIERFKTSDPEATTQSQNANSNSFTGFIPSRTSNNNLGPLAARLSRPSRGTMRMLREILTRATAFIIGYILTYIFSLIHRMMELQSVGSTPPALIFLARLFFPSQGLFNILIYMYPHVLTYQRNHHGTSWFRAFWEVIKSGGDSDQRAPSRRFTSIPLVSSSTTRTRTRTSTRRLRNNQLRGYPNQRSKEPVVLDVNESFKENAEQIKSSYHERDSSCRSLIVPAAIADSNDEGSEDGELGGDYDDDDDDDDSWEADNISEERSFEAIMTVHDKSIEL